MFVTSAIAERCASRSRPHNRTVIDVDEDTFGKLVELALDGIPAGLRREMSNIAIAVEDLGASPNLLGLYHGIPLTQRTTQYAGVMPDRITIYRLPILRRCQTLDDVVRQVRITVVHEVAHHFGIGDARLHELGWA
jgi:predicted Zn-dependent protease with MMP-like domain